MLTGTPTSHAHAHECDVCTVCARTVQAQVDERSTQSTQSTQPTQSTQQLGPKEQGQQLEEQAGYPHLTPTSHPPTLIPPTLALTLTLTLTLTLALALTGQGTLER